MTKHILVVASTFPAHDTDPVPAFVKEQIIALKKHNPQLKFSVLAPHDLRSNTRSYTKHATYDEYRFHYAWPYSIEKLAGRGIMPALKANPLNYLLVPFLFFGEFFALLRLVHKLKPNIIYAHWFTPQAVIARYIEIFTRTPFVFTTHALDVEVWHRIPLFGRLIVRNTTRQAKGFTAVSRRSMHKLERFFPASEWKTLQKRAQIIPMGLNLPDVSKETKGSNHTSTSILFVGRLAEKKGVHYLLPAFAELRKDFPDAKLTIAGDGPWLKKLQQMVRELHLDDSVDFPGYVNGKDKQNLITAANIYVTPSIIASDGDTEGLPVAFMEGLAYGKICIATHESGADDIISHGKDGFLVPQKDVCALTETLKKAIKLNPQQRRLMSQLAKTTSEQFSWTTIAKQYTDFLFKDN